MKLKYILALADCIRFAATVGHPFSTEHIEMLAEFCRRNHRGFDRAYWIRYIRDGPPAGR